MNTNFVSVAKSLITNTPDFHISITSNASSVHDWISTLSPLVAAFLAILGVVLTAYYTVKRGILDARYGYASNIFQHRIRQLTEFYAPMLVNVEKSRRLYEKLLLILEANNSAFKRSEFRLLDRMHELSNKDERCKPVIEAIINTGEKMSQLIIDKSALIEGGVTNYYIDYVAHFEILKAAKLQPPPPTANPGWHKYGYYTRLLNREIMEGHKCIMSRIRPYMKAGDRIVGRLLNQSGSPFTIYQPEPVMKILHYYEDHAKDFAKRLPPKNISLVQDRFIERIQKSFGNKNQMPQIRIMDLGCGTGRDSEVFLKKGYNVLGIDGSPAMLGLSREKNESFVKSGKLELYERTYDEIDFNSEFEGIWATAAFVHLSPEEIKSAINLCADAMVDAGVLLISVKYGSGSEEYVGRQFFRYNEASLRKIFSLIPSLNNLDIFVTDSEANILTLETLSAENLDSAEQKKLFINVICNKKF
jgi:SAM-dependent methyltransferase